MPEPNDHKHEWSIWKDILGTLIALAPFVLVLFSWGVGISERVRVMEVRVDREESYTREQREQIIKSLDRLSTQVEAIQQSMPRRGEAR